MGSPIDFNSSSGKYSGTHYAIGSLMKSILHFSYLDSTTQIPELRMDFMFVLNCKSGFDSAKGGYIFIFKYLAQLTWIFDFEILIFLG